jgi:hypothetical protein
MSVKDFQNKIHDLVHSFGHWFVSESQEVVNFLKPVAKVLERDGKHALLTAAISAVGQVEAQFTAPSSGGNKMSAALRIVEDTLVSAGLSFVESEARTVIEIALQGLKDKQVAGAN